MIASLTSRLGGVALLLSLGACTVANDPTRQIGLEVQAYPAGVIPGVHLRREITERDVYMVRFAANLTDRSDFGEHDDESGEGFGGGIGWRRTLDGTWNDSGWLVGARVDLWRLEIDWKDPGPRSGTSNITVLQPTAEVGYGWTTDEFGRLELTLGLGAEINVDTDGEDVGEGAIGLIGLTWLR